MNKRYKWLICPFLLFVIFSCGDDNETNNPHNNYANTGSYIISLKWPTDTPLTSEENKETPIRQARQINCEITNVSTVRFKFYDESNSLLVENSWPCTDHEGIVDGIPTGTNRNLVATAEDLNGTIIYCGNKTGITINANETTEGGELELAETSFIEYYFNASTENWTTNLGTATFQQDAERGGGYLYLEAPGDGKTSYFIAPCSAHTDWTIFCTELRISLMSSGGSYFDSGYGSYGDVYLANGDMTAQRKFGHPPASNWEEFIIPLEDDGNWELSGGAQKIEDVLQSVTDFQIRAEYGVGTDFSGLDDVICIYKN